MQNKQPSVEDESGQHLSPAQTSDPFSEKTHVSWTASEYIDHHKSPRWYGILLLVTMLAAAAVFLLGRDVVSAIVVTLVGILFGVFASRKPEVREYTITNKGVRISGNLYGYDMFRSYAIHQEDSISSVLLVPVKRFMPGLNIYYPPGQEEAIAAALADYLPFEDREPDAVDKLMSKIRF